MASILHHGLRLAILPNDHAPPHCHVYGAGFELRIALSSPPALLSVKGKVKRQELIHALLAVHEHLTTLKAIWSQYHG